MDAASFDALPCCGIKSPTHPGRRRKGCWLQANGEFAWRGVDAAGFMFIHCVWVFFRRHQRKGWDEKVAQYSRGLTIIRSSQCPHIAKFAAEIAEAAEKEYHLTPAVVDIESWSDAQNAHGPYEPSYA